MNWKSLPKLPGIYIFKDKAGKIIYIGKAKSLRDRVSSYFGKGLLPKTAMMMSEAFTLDHIVVESEVDALLLEANLIRKFQPVYNIDLKDGKSFPLIEITIKDKIPWVQIARSERDPKAVYFGPYPQGSDLRQLLRYLRRIFPFVSQNHPKNARCFRSHLNLCPCPDIFSDKVAQKRYKKNIRHLISFLSGRRKSVQKMLVSQMQKASDSREYELAGEIKQKLIQIDLLTSYRTRPVEYEVNPNLYEDRRSEESESLASLLGLKSLIKIECYDISNTQGTNSTGAQVVFIDGIPEKSLYRRYKIKQKQTPDDFAMMHEMLSRRLKSNTGLPDLIVIDGGLGQLSSLPEIPVPVIGLAKRLETVIKKDGSSISLPIGSPALNLLQRLRDEAHRFSRRYHFHLRKRSMLS